MIKVELTEEELRVLQICMEYSNGANWNGDCEDPMNKKVNNLMWKIDKIAKEQENK